MSVLTNAELEAKFVTRRECDLIEQKAQFCLESYKRELAKEIKTLRNQLTAVFTGSTIILALLIEAWNLLMN